MAAKGSKYRILSPDAFKEGFDVESFLTSIASDALGAAGPVKGEGPAAIAQAKATLQRVKSLRDNIAKAEVELQAFEAEVSSKLSEMQQTVSLDENQYKEEIYYLEGGVSHIRDVFKDLDTRMSRVSQTSTRIGDHLQHADTLRLRALQAMELIGYIHNFSMLPNTTDFSALPDVFTRDEQLARAALLTRQMLALTGELVSSRGRSAALESDAVQARDVRGSMRGSTGGAPSGTANQNQKRSTGIGTLSHCVAALEGYAAVLEARVVARFDAAAEANDPRTMRECARVMVQFDREKALIQRYVATRPMFLEIGDDADVASALADADPSQRVRVLQPLYRELLEAVQLQARTIDDVFPQPQLATEMLLQRMYEQRVRLALERVLTPPRADDPAALQAHLKLLVDCYERTCELSSRAEEAVAGLVDCAALGEAQFSTFLADYPQQELDWMRLQYQAWTCQSETPELSLPLASALVAWHREATGRAVRLTLPAGRPHAARLLFHASTPDVPAPGCLLEQLARHIIGGVDHALVLCSAPGGLASLQSLGLTAVTRSSANTLATSFIDAKIRKVLQAARISGDMMSLLQRHYEDVVLPHVRASAAEHSACAAGLLALMRAVEDSVLVTLRKAIDAFFAQVDKVLRSEQKRSDFAPRDDASATFDRATPACVLVTAMLSALHAAARDSLAGANLASVLLEVGGRMHSVLLAHMCRFSFSPMGALKWKNDVAEYAAAVRALELPHVNDDFINLQALVNVLLVNPESLLGLVNGSLRLNHKEALRYVALREDFRTAKVDGRTLTQLFTADNTAEQMPNFKG